MRGSTKVCLALGAVFAAVSLAWMIFLPRVVEHELRAVTGFDVRVKVLKADPFTGQVVVEGLTAKNPPSYPTDEFFELRVLRADVNLFSCLFAERAVINRLDVDVEKIALIRQHDGKSNAGDFMAAFSRGSSAPSPGPAAPAAPRKPRAYLIRKLHIQLEELEVADYTGSSTEKKSYKLKIDQTYNDVTNPRQLLVPSVINSLYAFGLHHDIAKLLPGDFGQALADTVGGVAHIGSSIKKSLKDALDKLEQSPKP
jgi:hypothetical protein